jgi:hypothetical protein
MLVALAVLTIAAFHARNVCRVSRRHDQQTHTANMPARAGMGGAEQGGFLGGHLMPSHVCGS